MCDGVELINDELSDDMASTRQRLQHSQHRRQLLGNCARVRRRQHQRPVVQPTVLTNTRPVRVYSEENKADELRQEFHVFSVHLNVHHRHQIHRYKQLKPITHNQSFHVNLHTLRTLTTMNVNTLPSLCRYVPLIRLRHMALYKCVFDYLI